MRRICLPLAFLALLVLASRLPAGEEDAPAVLTPEQRLEAALQALPPPSEARSFTQWAEIRMEGASVGRALLKAVSGTSSDDTPVWFVAERYESIAVVSEATGTVDRHLAPIEGQWVSTDIATGTTTKILWRRTAEGYEITPEGGGEPSILKTTGPCFIGLTHLLLFARLYHPARDVFACKSLEGEEPQLADFEFEVGKPGMWRGLGALLLETQGVEMQGVETQHVEAGFDRETCDFLGALITTHVGGEDEDAAYCMELRPLENEPEEPQVDDTYFTRAASTPTQAALQAVLAMTQGDVETVEGLIHWPRFHAWIESQRPAGEEGLDLEGFKAHFFALVEKAQEGRPPYEMMRAALARIRPDVDVQARSETEATVVLPPLMESRRFDVARIDGRWYVVAIP